MRKCKRRATDQFDRLPSEVITEILLRVPVSCLVRNKRVCKTWYGLINDPTFIKTHLGKSLTASTSEYTILITNRLRPKGSLYSFNVNQCQISEITNIKDFNPYGSLVTVDSCNGLLCFAVAQIRDKRHAQNYILYNPATRTYKDVPVVIPPYATTDVYPSTFPLAFAYDSVSDDYNILIVAMLCSRRTTKRQVCSLYSLKKDAWEMIQFPPWDFRLPDGDTVFANNAVHWLFHTGTDIKCFHLSTRTYYDIQLPQGTYGYFPKLMILNEKLHVVTETWNIWVLKEYNDPKSWTLLFRPRSQESTNFGILWDSWVRLGCLQHGNHINLVISNIRVLQKFLICCDLSSGEVTKVKMPGLLQTNLLLNVARPWVDSLVPLHYPLKETNIYRWNLI